VTPQLMFGAEADYDRAYDGVAPQGYRGQALYFGPTFHYQISEKIDFSAAFIAQATTTRSRRLPQAAREAKARSGVLNLRALRRAPEVRAGDRFTKTMPGCGMSEWERDRKQNASVSVFKIVCFIKMLLGLITDAAAQRLAALSGRARPPPSSKPTGLLSLYNVIRNPP
jgi:hypothetical protein